MAAQICALCGIRPATTRGHVPARQLWDPPRPNDLITVPACGPCNTGTQQDDDYFRAALALNAEPTPSAALERIRPSRLPRFLAAQSCGNRPAFAPCVKFSRLSTAEGILKERSEEVVGLT
jgi:hypothetical protein